MCGICGIVRVRTAGPVEEGVLKRMCDAMIHRGPDDAGLFIAGNVGLGHRRLSIIDLSGGHQPMANAEETVWITYNGEVYNFQELRTLLKAKGYTFRTKSDTEVILHAYEAFGDACVEHLRGMFAFALWDQRRGRLLMARDRLGIKPLYYVCTDRELLFASEIKAILASGLIRPAVNLSVLPEFLANRFVAGEETLFQGIRKLLPGRILIWSLSEGFCQRRYWQPPTEVMDVSDPAAMAQDVRRGLEEAVRLHLVSDVPLGLFLSGGIDSSAIAALMAPMLSEPLQTFSVGFEEQEANELAYARLVARHVRAEHHETVVSPERFFEALPLLIWHEDEPIAFPSSVPLYFVSRLARDHVKVVLTGEGADELFLGYPRYWVTMWNRRLGQLYHRLVPAPFRGLLSRGIEALPWLFRRYLSRTFLRLNPDLRTLFYENFAVFPTPLLMRLLAPAHRDLLRSDVYGTCLAILQASGPGLLEQMAVADLQTYLVELLMKQDQMSMAASIESRVPFLDHVFVERVMRVPGHLRLQGRETKAIFRSAVSDLLPSSILSRQKMGFPVPVGRWFRERFRHLVDEFVLGQRALTRGYFDPMLLHQMAAEHHQGRGGHADRLWLLINLELWHRIFIEGEDPAALHGLPVPIGEMCTA